MEQVYTNYYLSQVGFGLEDIGPLYRIHPQYIQRGSGGIGAFFSAVYRHLKPIFKYGLQALKRQTIKTGTKVINELGSKPIKEILLDHGKRAASELAEEGIKKLKKMQEGEGTAHSFNFKPKRSATSIKSQLIRTIKKKRNTLRKKKKKIVDIFSK